MIITLCGSTKFKEQFLAVNRELSLRGHVVLSVAGFGHQPGEELTTEEKLILDLVHMEKIRISSAIVVIGQKADGWEYIGASTRKEIAYARMLGKKVYFTAPKADMHAERSYESIPTLRVPEQSAPDSAYIPFQE